MNKYYKPISLLIAGIASLYYALNLFTRTCHPSSCGPSPLGAGGTVCTADCVHSVTPTIAIFIVIGTVLIIGACVMVFVARKQSRKSGG